MLKLIHPANWRCANNYLENPFDSPSGLYIVYAKFDSTASAAAGDGKVIIANRDGSNPIEINQTVRVANQLYGAFQAWIEHEGVEYVVFANQQSSSSEEGVGYIATVEGEIVASFPGVPRTLSPDGRHCAHSNHDSLRSSAGCDLFIIDMWAGVKTNVADVTDFQAIYGGAVPTTWDDIGTRHSKWSPNGKYIAIPYNHEPDNSLFLRMAMWNTETETLLDLFDYNPYHHQLWHPNGYEMTMVRPGSPSAYMAYNVETDAWRTLIENINGSSTHGSISPDGLKVATDTADATGPVNIWTIGADLPASRKRVYTNAALDTSATLHAHTQWSRDSQSILFAAENGRLYEYRSGGMQSIGVATGALG